MKLKVDGLTPILNVSSIEESVRWFAKLGWSVGFLWNEPPDFGSVKNGSSEIFLCLDGQGCRAGADETGGTWMTWWVATPSDVDVAHELAVKEGIEVTMPPIDMPWDVRECHIRHPDGHTFRVSCGLEAA